MKIQETSDNFIMSQRLKQSKPSLENGIPVSYVNFQIKQKMKKAISSISKNLKKQRTLLKIKIWKNSSINSKTLIIFLFLKPTQPSSLRNSKSTTTNINNK